MNKWIRDPVVLFAGLLVLFSLFQISRNDKLDYVIRSDGNGYYAYLPALLIFNDGTYAQSLRIEKKYNENGIDQPYLYKSENGRSQNKYFPGIAILQLPFFSIACLVSWISGQPVDGYSAIFLFCFYIGSLFYAIAGLFLFSRSLRQLFPDQYHLMKWFIPLVFTATPLSYYMLEMHSFTHLYSFFLFGLFTQCVIRLKSQMTSVRILILGLILGLIVLVRPTNILVVLILPFLLQDYPSLVRFFKNLLRNWGKYLLYGLSGFLCMIALLLALWKWQTGHWIMWSYNGEGFNFLHPKLISSLFSVRIGLFIHTPILFLSIAGLVVLFRKNRFSTAFWVIYFLANAWVISSWWCWDYESPFGNRPYTEHLFFLVLPLFTLIGHTKTKLLTILLCLFSVVGIIRFWEATSGFMGDQRFTSANYFQSLAFWNRKNHGRWLFSRSSPPFGKKVNTFCLLNDPEIKNVSENDEYIYTVSQHLTKPRTDERFYFKIEFEKKIEEDFLEEVFLVIDSKSEDESARYYRSIELMNDRFEGRNGWTEPLIFEGIAHDNFQQFDVITIYIWNKGKKKFSIRNVKFMLLEYKS